METGKSGDLKKFPIVGIGASAGGLEAFEVFFSAMPENPEMAFVLVAHLDPNHTSLLPELIQRKTKMKVSQVTENLKVLVNHIYIIPPNKGLAISNGSLQLMEIPKPRVSNLPIDSFLRFLARDQGSNAACIILSGTGADGSLGIRAIKGELGMVMAQDEESAQFSGMPHNAIATGLVDYVLPPQKLPDQLIRYFRYGKNVKQVKILDHDEESQTHLQSIFLLLRATTDHDFSLYKQRTISRRIERRMQVHQIGLIGDYVGYLKESEREQIILFKELLIGVTSFFRDPEAFEILLNQYIPALLSPRVNGSSVRVWVAGCSTGEEVYSLAIIFHEWMRDLSQNFNIQIFGTDIDEDAVKIARSGIYPLSISDDVSSSRLKKYFTLENNHYQIKKKIREMVIFAPQNVISDPPFTKLDMLSCRNLLIYFGSELQKRLLPVFHYALKKDGILFLGSSESVGQLSTSFNTLDKKWKIFRKISSERSVLPEFRISSTAPVTSWEEKEDSMYQRKDDRVNSLKLLKSILSQSNLPACVVIDDQANIIYIHGRTGEYLEPAEGLINNNIIDMARPGLKSALTSAISKMAKNRQETITNGLRVKDNNGFSDVNLILRPMPDFQAGCHGMMMVIFEKVPFDQKAEKKKAAPEKRKDNDKLKRLEDELQYTKENLQTSIEELETSNEELKSTNEELQSTNEELQSTNEELETSKEELQSLNEESITVNAELQCRIDELVMASDDIKNLLDATNIATIFLDTDLAVRRFTPMAVEIFPLTLMDLNRPISHFASKLLGVSVVDLATKVLKDLAMEEVEVRDCDGETYRMRIRPYRTTSNVIDGVVITFENVTKIKKIEANLERVSSAFEDRMLIMSKVFMDSADPIVIEDLEGRIIDINDEAINTYGWTHEAIIGKPTLTLVPEDRHKHIEALQEQCRKGKPIRNAEELFIHRSGTIIPVLLTFSLLSGKDGEIAAIATIAKKYTHSLARKIGV